MTRTASFLISLLMALTASAQEPLFDPNNFLDPRATEGRPVFISRIVVGAASNMTGDGLRPLGENVGYVHLANSFSWRGLQFDYKRSEMRAEDGEAAVWEFDDRSDQYRRMHNATPKSKDTLHAAWYWAVPASGGIPVMIRSRVTFTTQEIETDVADLFEPDFLRADGATGSPQTSSRENTFALDTDTWFRIAGREFFGSLSFSETRTSGARTDPNEDFNRNVRTLAYTHRLRSLSYDKARIVIRPTLKVGGISNRGGSTVNLISPAIEIFRPFINSGANLHVIWSPQWAVRDDGNWKVQHQVAVLIDRALFVKVF